MFKENVFDHFPETESMNQKMLFEMHAIKFQRHVQIYVYEFLYLNILIAT